MKIMPQLAVFLDNRPGMLARLCKALAKQEINIIALSMLDTVDHAIIRMVVDKPDEAKRLLEKLPVMVQVRDVIFLDLPNQVGALAQLAERLTEAGINLEYAYSAGSATGPAGLILRTNDLEGTINALS